MRLSAEKPSERTTKPYTGHWAHIEYGKDSFTISDNCGGIPWALHDYAFRMGRAQDRPIDTPGTVGVYGIGMKRAIFKLGTECLISTRHKRDEYNIEITPEWMKDEADWDITAKAGA